MAEYIERDKIVKWLRRVARLLKATENHKGKTKLIGQIIDHINKTSLADVVEVVRCKDCKHRNHDSIRRPWCDMWEVMLFDDATFCSYGERKAYVPDKNVGNIIPVNDLYDEDGADVQNT